MSAFVAAAALAAMIGAAGHAIAQQKRWAAIDPNSEVSSPVVWGTTEDEARQRAIDACKRLSKTCANGPAVTDDLKEVFAVVCCEQPRTGCAASAAANRRDAAKNAQPAPARSNRGRTPLHKPLQSASRSWQGV